MPTSILPDPTADLDWGGWDRAIHEVFADNASRHPDRICVTETSPWRQFTYQQLHHASNVIAHHLVSVGIVRGDVVMTYAHRNVDLVIAIMGILKAGATFSVLDPQYPDDRQITYLDVSRPRALIVIGKAKGSGLAKKVADWIGKNLELKTTLPKLTLQDDGTVVGGQRPDRDEDVLVRAQANANYMPDVNVGPDSCPTLSFTSGSEGKPKGVLGRHFSLVYYFPWMAERFSLSEHDRFTMLSGIAHDPIQRDIFTPLFLGAQILIPSQEDIQHVRLAEWMNEHSCTVTHLTPAMGQILIGGAITKFPALRNAFFVGDILVKRDVRRLQELAPNVRAINMLGTTETQRAVSYFAMPSRNEDPGFLDKLGDKIPAGKGMKNVQLLVVDRENPTRICDIDESGEIYVRAAGLAEGYLGLEEYTKEKFVTNWLLPDPQKWSRQDEHSLSTNGDIPTWREHYKGPRDRLYRTGDLGHYTMDGNVECTGRADNQVKVRGFRIELGDIDANLAQHPFVRENITLLKRDPDEEHRLVSYIVAESRAWHEWLTKKAQPETNGHSTDCAAESGLQRPDLLRVEIRSFLKTKLAEYAVPEVVTIMDRFPLNPNGKVEKSALPNPSFSPLSERPPVDPSALTQTETALSRIFASVLPGGLRANTVCPSDSFFDLGGESLRAQTLLQRIKKTWQGIKLPMQTIFDNPTLRGLSSEVDRALDPQGYVIRQNGLSGLSFAPPDQLPQRQERHYCDDAEDLANNALPTSFPTLSYTREDNASQGFTILLTGSTGFLGSFILYALLTIATTSNGRQPGIAKIDKVILPIRASDSNTARERIQRTLISYHNFSPSFIPYLYCLPADLSHPRLGLLPSDWESLASKVNIVIHNGANVHWVYPYSKLRSSNVLSTMELLNLCALDPSRPKKFTFISSTAVLDSSSYVTGSSSLRSEGKPGIPESDDLSASSHGLATGYAQTKWTSEYLVRAAGARGLVSSVVRPGYVLGDSQTGASVVDDFLVRLLKGCVQIGCRPKIENTLNACPVDYVARIAVAVSLPFSSGASATEDSERGMTVYNVTPHPRHTFTSFLSSLSLYGYACPVVPYRTWADKLVAYDPETQANGLGKEQHALLPLFDYATEDLEGNTAAVELDDSNTRTALSAPEYLFRVYETRDGEVVKEHPSAITHEMIGKYLAYLIAIGFMPPPASNLKALSGAQASEELLENKNLSGKGRNNLTPKSLALPAVDLSAEKRSALSELTGRATNKNTK